MLNQLNELRAKANKPALVMDSRLNYVAQQHSDYQNSISQLTHKNANGSLGERCARAGIKWRSLGENVVFNTRDVASSLGRWYESEGHRANMLGDFKVVGFGRSNLYWTQDFAVLS